MSTESPRQHYKFVRRARNWGLSALAAATIGGYTLYQRSVVSAQVMPTPTTIPSATAQATAEATAEGLYKDGQYTGTSVQAERYGNVQVIAIIQDGKLANFQFNEYPYERSLSLRISQVALPELMQEAVQAQNASVDIISGATFTSEAFIQSLQSALAQASTGAAVSPTPAPTLTTSGGSI